MQNPVTVEFRHFHIADDHVRTLPLGALDTHLAMLGLNDLIACELKDVRRRGPEELIVLHDENFLGHVFSATGIGRRVPAR